jgi:7-cyano-7-deazaguanine synthase
MGQSYDSVAIFSGGLDSTTLVYEMMQQGLTPHLLSFNYGQRHSKELDYALGTSAKLGLRHDIVNLTGITYLISNSALTAPMIDDAEPGRAPHYGEHEVEVPEGHYAEDNMKLTVVPNRNMIMLSIAAGVMINNSYKLIGTGVHAGDHFVYPDCRPDFLSALNAAVVLGNEGFGDIPPMSQWVNNAPGVIYAPFIMQSKADIAVKALELGVPLDQTWSCYKGGENHCGKCGTCVERLEAIDEAYHKLEWTGPFDPTVYDDIVFWKTAKAPTAAE